MRTTWQLNDGGGGDGGRGDGGLKVVPEENVRTTRLSSEKNISDGKELQNKRQKIMNSWFKEPSSGCNGYCVCRVGRLDFKLSMLLSDKKQCANELNNLLFIYQTTHIIIKQLVFNSYNY